MGVDDRMTVYYRYMLIGCCSAQNHLRLTSDCLEDVSYAQAIARESALEQLLCLLWPNKSVGNVIYVVEASDSGSRVEGRRS